MGKTKTKAKAKAKVKGWAEGDGEGNGGERLAVSTGGDFWGARPIEVKATRSLTRSARVNAIVGSTIRNITRPADKRFLAFQVLSDGFNFKTGLHPNRIFFDADVNISTDEVTMAGHFFTSGVGPWQLTTSGTLPAGLNLLTDYFIGAVTTGIVSFHLTHNDAVKDKNRVDITAASGGGVHTLGGLKSTNPSATNEDGQERQFYSAANTNGNVQVVAVGNSFSIAGDQGTSNMVYWWLP